MPPSCNWWTNIGHSGYKASTRREVKTPRALVTGGLAFDVKPIPGRGSWDLHEPVDTDGIISDTDGLRPENWEIYAVLVAWEMRGLGGFFRLLVRTIVINAPGSWRDGCVLRLVQ